MANLVYDEKELVKYENVKSKYQKFIPKKIRKALRGSLLFKLYRCTMVANEKTFFPEMERKSHFARLVDNYKWFFKYHKVCFFYNRWGLDIKNFRNMNDYLEFTYVKKDRALVHHKGHPLEAVRKDNINVRYSILADNKHIFYSYVGGMFPNNVPKNVFIFSGDKVIMPFSDSKDTKKHFSELPEGKYICKPEIGSHGDMIVAFTKTKKGITFSNPDMIIDDLIKKSIYKPFIVQEFIKQHPKINTLNATTVNTIRIISTHWNEKTHILAAMIRVGTEKSKVVDNADAGGTFIAIDTQTGTLNEYGYFYNKPRTKQHPSTGTVYKGFKIPYWKELIKLITDLHPIIFGFATIGWDIAITEEGPVIVEINWNYSLKGIQVCNGGLKPRWEELKLK